MLGKMAKNDLAESSFGAVKNQMQKFTRINIAAAAAAASLVKRASFIKIMLVLTAMEDAPRTRRENRFLLNRQCKVIQMKEEMIKEKGLQKATEEDIDMIYYYNIYKSSGC